ncbi:MAG: ribosome assembly RNA-binding protein YhbY [Pseudomonadota bacterium]
MTLTDKQRKHLRGLGHALKPVVYVAEAGLRPSVLHEIYTALKHHELIKVSIRVGDREARAAVLDELAEKAGATVVQRVGNVALLYRPNPDKPRVDLPG